MTAGPGTTLELITVGRICVDLYANEANASFMDPQTFTKSVGGSATNVAIAAARLGRRTAVFTKVGDDPFGEYVRHKLELFGVDTQFVGVHPSMPTPLAFAAMDPPEDPKLLMYRYPIGSDQTLQASEIDLQAAIDVPILWLTGAWFSKAPAREACWALLLARARKPQVVFDLDYRANFWPSVAEATADISPVLEHVTVALGNRVECEVAVGSGDPPEAARRLLDRGVELAVVKMGGEGVMVATLQSTTIVPPYFVKVVSGLGAGDAFGGMLVHGLLSGWDPVRIVEYCNVAGAIVASRLLCSDAMPTLAEVEEALEDRRVAG
ncbi:MAG: 5-dehydro-2-deoxygluconokinase [Ilumatobacteraceae bacterium]|nr:5-dehydro-2-deoxygluconokinase [Ilumatobacteraceae bacterium]